LARLLPWQVALAHRTNTPCAGSDASFYAVFNDCDVPQVWFDFSVAPAAYIHTLMSDLYRKYGLFPAYFTDQMLISY